MVGRGHGGWSWRDWGWRAEVRPWEKEKVLSGR